MIERWYRQAVIYCLDVETFQDSNGDGIGDLRGLASRLDYLARLGVTTLWLNPIHPSPRRDGGYDVTDHYGVHPQIGSLGDFAELLHLADNRGLRVLLDLVLNHTSDEHPWFRSARARRESPYHGWYVWSDTEPPDRFQGTVFPGEQSETWSWDEQARAWYFHRFHRFEPDLNMEHPAVREEILKILGFWLRLGVSGFRLDAAPFVIERVRPGDPQPPRDYALLSTLRAHMSWRLGDSLLLAEANVPLAELPAYFGEPGGGCDRAQMLFAFRLNAKLMLALARGDAEPVIETLASLPPIPSGGQWATFLRNHDEVDLSTLTAEQRREVFGAFGPDPEMQIYGRGLRRRLAPMLGGDQRRLRMAYSVQFTLPGTPILRYGDEIGMGEDLSLPERDAIRTPMQWDPSPGAGFSSGQELIRPVVTGGSYGYQSVNVVRQRRDPDSLLHWFERMLHTLRECPEVGVGTFNVPPADIPRHVLVHRFEAPTGILLFLHSLSDHPAVVDLGEQPGQDGDPLEVFADADYEPADRQLRHLPLNGYGYRWFRLSQAPGPL